MNLSPHLFSEIVPCIASITQPHALIEEASTDSRDIFTGKNTVFFALKTNYNDGEKFIKDLFDRGVLNFVVHSGYKPLIKANFFFVEDTLKSLQLLAAHHRNYFTYPLVVITGSNGKTTVKEWLFQLAETKYNTIRSPKSYNSQIGVAHTLLTLEDRYDLALVEAGISQKNEMDTLSEMIAPTLGIFTNIGTAHGENFRNEQEKIEEKSKAFRRCHTIIYCKDHKKITDTLQKTYPEKRHVSWSLNDPRSDLYISNITTYHSKSRITASYQTKEISIEVPFKQSGNIENIMHCWLTSLVLEVPIPSIRKSMMQLDSIEMRLETMSGICGSTVINDTYNSDITSVKQALNFLSLQESGKEKTLIISDVLQTKNRKQTSHTLAQLINSSDISTVICIGEAIKDLPSLIGKEVFHHTTTEDFLKNFDAFSFKDRIILCKGARKFCFERIVKKLALQNHDTTLEINIPALIDNVRFFQKKLKPEVKIMAVIKAEAYSCGAAEVSQVLAQKNISHLAVAFTDEGIHLRSHGIQRPIVVFHPDTQQYQNMIEYKLEPSIFHMQGLINFEKTAKRSGLTKYPIHLKVNSGMNRLGFEPSEMDEPISFLKDSPYLQVSSVFSHLAASGDIHQKEFTLGQIENFNTTSLDIAKKLNYNPMRHILNTEGILYYPEHSFDMVRVGIGLYGVLSHRNLAQSHLKNVVRLTSVISQIKLVKKGDSIGYDRSYITEHDVRVATIPIGYADGLPRTWSKNGYVIIKGEKASIIGQISMDTMIVDVSDIPCQTYDTVCIAGENPSYVEISEKTQTIPHEILSKLSPRIKRVYTYEGD